MENTELTHEEKISTIAKEIIKISDAIEKKVKQQEKIDEEINDLKRDIISKEEEAQDLIKEHLKELKKNLR